MNIIKVCDVCGEIGRSCNKDKKGLREVNKEEFNTLQ